MSDTMLNMELRFADHLMPNQLVEGDLIKLDEQYLTVDSITEVENGYHLVLLDDFDDETEYFVAENQQIEWYVFVE